MQTDTRTGGRTDEWTDGQSVHLMGQFERRWRGDNSQTSRVAGEHCGDSTHAVLSPGLSLSVEVTVGAQQAVLDDVTSRGEARGGRT